jgi:hypothetical protein
MDLLRDWVGGYDEVAFLSVILSKYDVIGSF